MAEKQEMAVREKKELTAKEEKTVPGRHFVEYADIYETDDALSVVLEMPGVEKKDLDVALENDVLRVDGRMEFFEVHGHGAGLRRVQRRPLRALVCALWNDRPGEDGGDLEDGVLTLTLPKAKHAQPRKIAIG